MITGSCLCGGIRYEVFGPLEPIQVCHCGLCDQYPGCRVAFSLTDRAGPAEQLQLFAGQAALLLQPLRLAHFQL